MTDTLELELAIKRARKTKREYANYLGISEMHCIIKYIIQPNLKGVK